MNDQASNQLFDVLEQELKKTNTNRDVIIGILMQAVQKDDLDLGSMSATQRESFMSIARELNSTMNSRDSSHVNVVKLKLQEKRDDQVTEGSSIVAEFLRSIKLKHGAPDGPKTDPDAAQEHIDKEFQERGVEIPEGELLRNDQVAT